MDIKSFTQFHPLTINLKMNFNVQKIARKRLGADSCYLIEDIQSLWSGYGKIQRYGLTGANYDRIVVKHVTLPNRRNHPRGWNTSLSHQRKVKSYRVESTWYRDWASACDRSCRVPDCLALESSEDEFLLVFEDLDSSGFSVRKTSVSIPEIQVCLTWLANFHATFMAQSPEGLWKFGTYWHLDTRPDELAALNDPELKKAADKIDQRLKRARFQSIVHGDAKLANFCFSQSSNQVAAVDFQYVGGGCGMKDVAYFIGSCLDEEECEHYETLLLDFYFSSLRGALKERNSITDYEALEQEWRELYPIAWTDFYRFMKGWSPEHWKIHSYSARLARGVVAQINLAPSKP